MKTSTPTKEDTLITVVTRAFILPSSIESPDGPARLSDLAGVLGVMVTPDQGKVVVTYDVRTITASGIDQALRSQGFVDARNLWERVRIAWLSALDENRRDNAAHHPACCSKPPPGTGTPNLRKLKK